MDPAEIPRGPELTSQPQSIIVSNILARVSISYKIACAKSDQSLQGQGNNAITQTCLYYFDPLKPHFYKVKLGFTGVYFIFLISVKSLDCGTR